MLLRLRIQGFKNLLDAEVRFGTFSCVAGANGAGKSNLFDAINFLKLTTQHDLLQAARLVRDDRGLSGNVRDLFYRSGDFIAPWMEFEADLLTGRQDEDALRQKAEATSTLLTYRLRLGFREGSESGPLEIQWEELDYTTLGRAHEKIQFPHNLADWRHEMVVNKRRTAQPYIKTLEDSQGRRILVQQDGNQGRPSPRLAEPLPRTVLSVLNASEAPTAVVARKEIASWRLLQLEPTALRRPDNVNDIADIGSDGSHLPATLHRMMQQAKTFDDSGAGNGEAVRQRIANRLGELVDDVRGVDVRRDDRRETLTLLAKLHDGTEHTARSLSDGTLRFLALALIEEGKKGGVYCLEEPENGIHPARVPAMLQLLRDIAVDPQEPPGDDNPLRQVIINTHSPSVVSEIRDDELLVAQQTTFSGKAYGIDRAMSSVAFAALGDTWRTKTGTTELSRGDLARYLNPILSPGEQTEEEQITSQPWVKRRPRVKERDDLQLLLPYGSKAGAA